MNSPFLMSSALLAAETTATTTTPKLSTKQPSKTSSSLKQKSKTTKSSSSKTTSHDGRKKETTMPEEEKQSSPPLPQDELSMLDQGQKRLEEYRNEVELLRDFINTMQSHPNVFDEEDLLEVKSYYIKKAEELTKLIEKQEKKENYYKTAIQTMKEKLDQRMNVFENDQATEIFKKNENMKQFFIQKQVRLTELYNKVCKTLLEEEEGGKSSSHF